MFFMIIGIIGVVTSLLMFGINSNDKSILDGKSDEKKTYAVQINPSSTS